MKTWEILLIIFSFNFTFCQIVPTADNSFYNGEYFNGMELNNFYNSGGKVRAVGNGIFKVQYPGGIERIFNFNNQPKHSYSKLNLDSTFISIYSLDTSQYSDLFSFWKQIQITTGSYYPLLVDDINLNGLPELYGYTSIRPGSFAGPVKSLELNPNGIINNLFSYDSTIFVKGTVDIRGSGLKSIYFHTDPTFTQSGCFYTSSNKYTVPDSFDFILNYKEPDIGFQVNDMTFGDFNKNGLMDCAYDCWSDKNTFIIQEYDSLLNNFSTKFLIDTIPGINISGMCVDDFDSDGKDEIIFNFDEQGYFVAEAESNNNYQIVYQGELQIDYPWLHTVTQDIDGNGRKEFWIGSMDYFSQTGTSLYAFEAGGNNSYKPVATIFIQGMVTQLGYYNLNAVDIDNDAKQELILSVGRQMIILKFTGSQGHHEYSVFYFNSNKGGEYVYYGACSFYDIDGDGLKDLILPFAGPISTYIFKQNHLNSVSEKQSHGLVFNLLQNFPNPFNPVTTIGYSVLWKCRVSLKVYDILGKEVGVIVNEEKPAGKYEAKFDGSNFSSGVYIYRIIAGSFSDSRKFVLIK